eukprot:5855818-Alexandrium_andersonii.AAC.1
MLLLPPGAGRAVRRARRRLHLYGARREPGQGGVLHERRVHVQGGRAVGRRRLGLAGGEAAEPHNPMDAGRAS